MNRRRIDWVRRRPREGVSALESSGVALVPQQGASELRRVVRYRIMKTEASPRWKTRKLCEHARGPLIHCRVCVSGSTVVTKQKETSEGKKVPGKMTVCAA